MNSPLVSIIIPTFNRAHLIGETLDSVLAQTYTNWECIVVDDGSTDETEEQIKLYNSQDSRILFIKRNRSPKGAPTCRNIGLENAKGEYLIYLDSDDYLITHCIEQRVNLFLKVPEVDFLVFPMGIRDNFGIKKNEIKKSDSYLVDFLSFKIAWSIMCPIWRKCFVLKINGYKEGYLRLNDPEFMIRALLEEDVNFIVFDELDFDSVYVPSVIEEKEYKYKYYKSLLKFIPDICKSLEEKNKSNLKIYLNNYLHIWFSVFYLPLESSKIKESLKLIILFQKEGVLSFSKGLELIISLGGYSINNYFLRKFKRKLKNKSFYNV